MSDQNPDLQALVYQQKERLLNCLSQKDQAEEGIKAARNVLLGLQKGLERESALKVEIDALLDEQRPMGQPSE